MMDQIDGDHRDLTSNADSGFDMQETILWYQENKDDILSRLPKAEAGAPEYLVSGLEQTGLSDSELVALINMFPEAARKRSVLIEIQGKPPRWFHRDSAPNKPVPADRRVDALSSTAIIPSYTDYGKWRELGRPAADIWLHDIEDVDPEIRKIILSEGFIHEFAHTIITPIIYSENYCLRLTDGQEIDGKEYLLGFAGLAEKYPPISHYASAYRGEGGKFESQKEDYNVWIAINEELAETIAAHLLNFVFYGKGKAGGLEPFRDREDLKRWVEDFLNAEKV